MTNVERLSVQAQQSGLKPPFFSIIIPVYNTQNELTECLMSAAFQTLPEVEVIIVNDASPDDSQSIIDRFTKQFPDRIRCIKHEENKGLSGARYSGVLEARAPYVLFLDSDDFVSGKICETLLGEVLDRNYDILFYGMDWYDTAKGERRTILPRPDCTPANIIKKGLASFSGAMFRRNFLLEHHDVAFRRMRYEDAAAMPVLVGLAQEIGVCRASLYFYNLGRPESITTDRMLPRKKDDLFYADIFPWENINEKLRPALAERILNRAVNNMRIFPEIYDYSVFHIKNLLELTENSVSAQTKVDFKALDTVRGLPNAITIPKRVYVNGFLRSGLRDFAPYREQAERTYLFDPEIVVLDGTTCKMAELPAWLRDRPEEEKGLFFAVQAIYEKGGIYISPAVRIVTSFNREAFGEAFFVAGPNNCVLPVVFGGAPKNPAFEEMLEVLREGPMGGKERSVAELMAEALISTCGVHLTGKEERGRYGLHMLHYKFVSRSTHRKDSYCELDYSNFIGAQTQDMVVRPRKLDDMAWDMASSELEYGSRNIRKLSRERNAAKTAQQEAEAQCAELEAQCAELQDQLNMIYGSRAWKMITTWRRIKDKILAAKATVRRMFRRRK